MATTTNFGWETPDDTDLVKDGALAMRTLGNAIDTSLVDLKGGTTGQNLRKNSNTDMDFVWAGDATNTVIDAEGDLLVGDSADTLQRLAIGTTGQVLTVDTAVDGKVKWAAVSGGDWVKITASAASAVSSHSISSCFSSTYKVYKIYCNLTGTVGADLNMKFRVGSTDTSTNYDYQSLVVAGTTFFNGSSSAQTSARAGDLQTYLTGGEVTIFDPYAANPTPAFCLMSGNGQAARYYTVRQTDSTSFDGITFIAGSGTFTGTFYVYGLKA